MSTPFRFGLFLGLLFIPLFGCKSGQQTVATSTPEVTVLRVAGKDVPVSVEFVAQTQSSHLVNIQARVSGFLEKRVYTEGSLVKEGQVLFEMDSKPFEVQLAQAEAALAKQEASLETARLNLERVKPLTAKNALSQKDLDDATGQYNSAAAAVDQARAQAESAKLDLSYCTITSPVTGISSSARQTDGTYVNAQNSLLTTVAVLSPMWVNFSLSENQIQSFRDDVAKGRIRPPAAHNYEVETVLVDGSIFPHRGRITFAEPSYSEETGTFLIRASVDNPQGVLRPNQYVRARLIGAVRPNAILVPQRAVQVGSRGHIVWIVDQEGKAQRRPVVVGDWHGDDWFIFEGLEAGDQVVVDGLQKLQPGISVTTKPYQPVPAPEGGAPAASR